MGWLARLAVVLSLAAQGLTASPPFRECYFLQPADHFDFGDNTTFHLRYLIRADEQFPIRPGTGGQPRPLFFYTGNEGDIEEFWTSAGFLFDIAPQHDNALVVFAEHRFYGKSLPYGSKSFAAYNIKKLTVEQALADYVGLISELRTMLGHTVTAPVPVVAFGGSYGGWLSAWLRMKYPEACDGAVAASANLPLAAGNVDEGAFFSAVTDDYTRANADCPDLVRSGFAAFEHLEAQADWPSLGAKLRLCEGTLQSAADARTLYLWMMNGFTTIAQLNYPYPAALPVAWPINHACDMLQRRRNEPLAAFADVMSIPYNTSLHAAAGILERVHTQKCFRPKDQFTECADQTGCDPGLDPWGYQTCTECLYATSTNNITDMFPPREWRLQNITEYCAHAWPEARQRPGWIGHLYGGKPSDWAHYSNIVFSNGLLDPWHKGGILQSISDSVVAIIIEDGAHHYDLRESNPDHDTPSVVAARKEEQMHIGRWIEQARRPLLLYV